MDNNHIRLATKDCPGSDCEDERNDGRVIYWNHSCGSESYLDKWANVECFNCNSKYSILRAKFKCRYDHQYKNCDYLKIGTLLTALAAIDDVRTKISNFDKKEFRAFLNNITNTLFQLKE